MNTRKQNLLAALRAFARQRSGMDPNNYGSWQSYQSERREVTRDLAHAQRLIDYVAWHDSITADAIVAAARGAFSGRLTIKPQGETGFALDYCTGQYFPTEYRKAVCAVLASAVWDWARDHCMPAPTAWRVESWSSLTGRECGKIHASRAAAETELAEKGGQKYGMVCDLVPAGDYLSPGDYLRRFARRELGRGIAARYFN